jgi:hypothetical protein
LKLETQFFSPLIRDFLAEQGTDDEFSGIKKPYEQPLTAEPGEQWNYGIGKIHQCFVINEAYAVRY